MVTKMEDILKRLKVSKEKIEGQGYALFKMNKTFTSKDFETVIEFISYFFEKEIESKNQLEIKTI